MTDKSPLARILTPLRSGFTFVATDIRVNALAFTARRQPLVWLLALVVGSVVALAAILFRVGIGLIQLPWLGTASENVVTASRDIPFYVILAAPVAGGLIVGLLLRTIPKRRTFSVADVMEARARGGHGLPFWPGISSALLTMLSLGSGASAGREGPVVHLGATLATALGNLFSLTVTARRVILACGVASAVSASFNAPIAGVLFAHEVVLGHYALSAIVPIAISSVAGTLIARLWFGDVAAFVIPAHQITSYWEFPAFALLGVTCAAVAVIFQFALTGSEWVARHISMPLWLRPVVGGAAVGTIALAWPEVLGVGYETTDAALRNNLPLVTMLVLLIAKTAATSITLASRFGGGIFSPSLYLGAMAGGAFGLVAARVFPDLASSEGLYSILGMGAVAAAMLGAPFSTTVIVFELTGGYTLSIALLITVCISTGLTLAVHGRSYFHWQLEMRGLELQSGAHGWLVRSVHVRDFMEPRGEDDPRELDADGDPPSLVPGDSMETALRLFDASGMARIPVVDIRGSREIVGFARHIAALDSFNKALIEASREEHQ
ncbi:CIC family chloride channel protein [Breoghania corrubedonensis]|uniref:CIC family chloride channel protein n=1 Tax=Breoghania corrubedonensis TaxID=665038 RepID=A0A2T5V4V9_9HYPH|nr:chloride channel protein [Breoghania corrubedonensis]PTW58784.1 CIC family chloride channel protein [Breoghania corrubedonensis]